MRDAHHVLLDDRAVVQHLGHVVRGRADQLHAPLESTLVGLGAMEGGQEGVMDVDHPVFPLPDELRRQHLHVARQDDEVDVVRGHQSHLLLLRLGLVFLVHGDVGERNLVRLGQPVGIRVVADDERNLAIQFAGMVAVQQVGQTVVEFRDEDRQARFDRGQRQAPGHLVFLGDRREGLIETVDAEFEAIQLPLHPHQEQAGHLVLMLIGVKDVGVVGIKKVGDGGDQALLIGAGHQQTGGISH